MQRHIAIGCALAAGTLLLAACRSNGIPSTNGGAASSLFAQSGRVVIPAGTNVLQNPCFSTGKLAPWKDDGTTRGKAVISKTEVKDCPYSAFMGTTSKPAVDGLHGIEQKVKIPTKAKLTWWYYADSDDEIKYANQEVDLMSGKTLVYQCFKKLVTSKKWEKGTCDLSKYAGKTYDLVLGVDDNGYSETYVYWYVDDISLTGK
jgi:hypothetical protein